MRLIFSLILILILASGCSDRMDQPVYDTAANSENFPTEALTLIDEIEAGSLVEYEQIIMRFADLYTEKSELLDSPEWKNVIGRLGDRFKLQADQAVAKGLIGYDQASAYYMLAAFADPSDKDLNSISRLFSSWRAESQSGPESLVADLPEMSLSDRVDLLKRFELGDSLSQSFSVAYIRDQIDGRGQQLFSEVEVAELSAAKLALCNYAGLTKVRPDAPLAEWEGPGIRLVASYIESYGSGWYRAELYFEAVEKIADDYTVALTISGQSDDSLPDTATPARLSFDFDPVSPTSTWKPGEIVAAAKRIYFTSPLESVSVGFYLRSDRSSTEGKLAGSDQAMFSLELPALGE